MYQVTIYRNEQSARDSWSGERVQRFIETLATGYDQEADRLKMWNSTMTVVVHDCVVQDCEVY